MSSDEEVQGTDGGDGRGQRGWLREGSEGSCR